MERNIEKQNEKVQQIGTFTYHTWKLVLIRLLIYFLLYSSSICINSFLFITIDDRLNRMIMKIIDTNIEIGIIIQILVIRK
jgi:hypothetical protein